MSATEDLSQQIKHSPDLPGVYLFRDGVGDVLYVGKALALRRRLAAIFRHLEANLREGCRSKSWKWRAGRLRSNGS